MNLFIPISSVGLLLCLIERSLSCPVGTYGVEACEPCPAHTTTTSAISLTIHDCRCQPGYLCMYYKKVHATVTLNTTLSDFENNTGEVRSSFIAGIAAAGGVEPAQVHIHFVVIRLNHRRRILSWHHTIQVSVSVAGTSTLKRVPEYLSGLHLAHTWELRRHLSVLAIPAHQNTLAALVAAEQNT